MKANELRIGNYLNIFNIPTPINGEFIADFSEDSSMFREVEPIPLAEEWLLRISNNMLEYKSIHYVQFSFSGIFTLTIYSDHVTLEQYSEGEVILEHIKYIHQIQNLYFALTGEELIIK